MKKLHAAQIQMRPASACIGKSLQTILPGISPGIRPNIQIFCCSTKKNIPKYTTNIANTAPQVQRSVTFERALISSMVIFGFLSYEDTIATPDLILSLLYQNILHPIRIRCIHAVNFWRRAALLRSRRRCPIPHHPHCCVSRSKSP